MTIIRFEPSGLEVEVNAPIALVEVTDANPAADVLYACLSASCGTCRVKVLEGRDALSEPEEDELEVLDLFDDDPATVRLCCQAKLIDPEADRVVIHAHDE